MSALKAYLLALFLPVLLIACATIPEGADPIAFRLKEAQLNVKTIQSTIPLAGYTEEDQARLTDLFTKIDEVLTDASTVYNAGENPLDAIEAAIPILNDIVAQIGSESARRDGQRLVATLNVTVQVLKNQDALQQEFAPAPP